MAAKPRLRRALPAGHLAFVSILSEKAMNARANGDCFAGPPSTCSAARQLAALIAPPG